MTVMEGGVLVISSHIAQRPHSGISLKVNGNNAQTSSDFDCTSPPNVLASKVVYNCTARSIGMMNVQSQTVFCDTDYYSQLMVEIKSEKVVFFSR